MATYMKMKAPRYDGLVDLQLHFSTGVECFLVCFGVLVFWCFGVFVFLWASLLVFENKGFPNSDTKSEAHKNTKKQKHQKTPLPPLLRREESFQQGKWRKILSGKHFTHKGQFEVFVRTGYRNYQCMRRLVVAISDVVEGVEPPVVRLDSVFREVELIEVCDAVAISGKVLKGFRKGGGVSHIKKRVIRK